MTEPDNDRFVALPKDHARNRATRVADLDLEGFVLDLMKKYSLTYAETFVLLAHQVNRLASSCLRAERSASGETS